MKILSESVAQLPLILYQRTENDGKERATEHPLYELLHDQANGWTSSFEFRLDMQAALCLHGNAYAFINRVGGRIAELIALPADTVTVDVDAVTMEPVYHVTGRNGLRQTYGRQEIFHLRTLGSCNIGASPVRLAREAIGLGLTMERHAGKLFGSGARPSGVFKYAKTLSKEALERLKKSFNAAHAGAENSGNTLKRTLDIAVRFDAGDGAGVFSGYASVFGEPDSFGDTIKPGAFRKTLREHTARKTAPGLFWMHDPAEPIGLWTDLAEDERGLKATGKLVLETTRGSEAHALLKAGALNGLSIGFRARSSERGPNGGRVLTDIDLVEISLVSLPAASKARVTIVKALKGAGSAAAFVNACRKATRSLNQRSTPCKPV